MALIDNLVSYYKCEEASGNLIDAHGSNDLTASGLVYGAAGIIGDAVTFSALDTVLIESVLVTVPFSVSIWIYPTNEDDGAHLFAVGDKDVVNDYHGMDLRWGANDYARCFTYSGPFGQARTDYGVLTLNAWNHIVAVWTSATSRQIYINGGNSNGVNTTNITVDNANRTCLGRSPILSYPFIGRIDEVALFNKALNLGEVVELWNSGAGLAYPFTVVNPYPVGWLKKKVVSGYHCFLGGYVNAKRKGYDPLKLPDGTVW